MKRKLGAILLQAPPEFTKTKATLERLENFLNNLPRDLEFAIEFRHKSWFSSDVADLLSQYNVALTIIDSPTFEPFIANTANFTYIRFHGRGKKVWYYYNYRRDELEYWAKIVHKLAFESKKFYIYFNNHFRGFAPKNAQEFIAVLGLSRADLGLPSLQTRLF